MFNMMFVRVLVAAAIASQATAQITLTGCILRNGQEVCLLPGGIETTIATSSSSSTIPSIPPPTTPTSVAATLTTAITAVQTTAITSCHMHETTQFCIKGDGSEVQVKTTATGNAPLPTAYTGCHNHDTEMFCMTPDGSEVEVIAEGAEASADSHPEEASGENCHFHAGVEHCVGAGESESGTKSCNVKQRKYNVNLRVGLIFVMLAGGGIGVYFPTVLTRYFGGSVNSLWFTFFKQFGTGVILSTALAHLMTHANLLWENTCLGDLGYEGTSAAIMMAGLFFAAMVDVLSRNLSNWRNRTADAAASDPESTNSTEFNKSPTPVVADGHQHFSRQANGPPANDFISVMTLEAGFIFHSVLLGVTSVVAGDPAFITLFIVILFHQVFEGIALGACIAAIPDVDGRYKWMKLLIMPLSFAITTPIGMAIGIAVLNKFNGNNPSTIIALGTLDSLSAGILLWVAISSMMTADWVYGDMMISGWKRPVTGLLGFILGCGLMSFLGKWA